MAVDHEVHAVLVEKRLIPLVFGGFLGVPNLSSWRLVNPVSPWSRGEALSSTVT